VPDALQPALLDFPVRGLDAEREATAQPPGTARDAQNVRAFEALTRRGRGGRRPGLNKYIPETVTGEVGHRVQHLNFVVTAGEDGLYCDGEGVPEGGSGKQPNPYCELNPQDVAFIQAKLEGMDWTSAFHSYSGTAALSFDLAVTEGTLILVGFAVYSGILNGQNPDYAVADSAGNTYTLAADAPSYAGTGNERPRMKAWTAFANATGFVTVTVTITWADLTDPGGSPLGGCMCILNYTGPTALNEAADLTVAFGNGAAPTITAQSGVAVEGGHLTVVMFSHVVTISPYTRTPISPYSVILGGTGTTGFFGQDREMTVMALAHPDIDPLFGDCDILVVGGGGVKFWSGLAVRLQSTPL
jgi:hypothetical protein